MRNTIVLIIGLVISLSIVSCSDGSKEDCETIPTPSNRALAPSVNVTSESGYTLSGRLTSWRTTSEDRTIEHLAGTNSTSHLIHFHLIHFHWSPSIGHWQAEDLSSLTSHLIVGNVTSWVTPDGPYVVEHIAGRDPEGRMLVIYRSTRNNQWKVVDVTGKTGRQVKGGFTSRQTPNGPYNVEHMAAYDENGRLHVDIAPKKWTHSYAHLLYSFSSYSAGLRYASVA